MILEQGKTRLLAEALRLRIARPDKVPDEVWQTFEEAGAAMRAAQAEGMTASPMRAVQTDETVAAEHERNPMEDFRRREQVIRAAKVALDAAIEQVRLYVSDFLRTLDLESIQSLVSESSTT